MKISSRRLWQEIKLLGGGEIPEYKLLRRLDISHGQFCQHRKELVAAGLLEVTHPNRKARYRVLEGERTDAAKDAAESTFFCPDVELVKCVKCPNCDKCTKCAKRTYCTRRKESEGGIA